MSARAGKRDRRADLPGIGEFLERQTGVEDLADERTDHGMLQTANCEASIAMAEGSNGVEAVCDDCGRPVDLSGGFPPAVE